MPIRHTFILTILFIVAISFPLFVRGHGRVMDPVHRGARWRFNATAPRNYNDHELFCGGFGVQWRQNGGRCGICGDNYAVARPRAHELGGLYGGDGGVVVRNYTQGQSFEVVVYISANHMGYFYFELCNLDVATEQDECFEENLIQTVGGADYWTVPPGSGVDFHVPLQLTPDMVCEHCVFRWTYVAGNNWGICPNGQGAIGCGPQETFRTCSDIRINRKSAITLEVLPEDSE